MHYYRALIQYDGTGYYGFQWQKDIPSIQDTFTQAFKSLVPGKVTTMGASRTDTGVHALHQVVRITSENSADDLEFIHALNRALPSQIHCFEFAPCERSFKPIHDCVSKEYRYLFTNDLHTDGADRRFVANNAYKLNIEAMRSCVAAIQGTHSFHNFVTTGSNVKSTEREIFLADLSEINPHELFSHSRIFSVPENQDRCFQLRIVGSGFLKQMIRHLVSALWLVGSGKLSEEEFLLLLKGPKSERRLWKVAHPKGLYLYKINYSQDL